MQHDKPEDVFCAVRKGDSLEGTLYKTYEEAENEACRLSKIYPGRTFRVCRIGVVADFTVPLPNPQPEVVKY